MELFSPPNMYHVTQWLYNHRRNAAIYNHVLISSRYLVNNYEIEFNTTQGSMLSF